MHVGHVGHRTTIVLDEESRAAARELAATDGCTLSEAIRRAILQERRRRVRVPADRVAERQRALERLFELFEGHDARAEIERLKGEDAFS